MAMKTLPRQVQENLSASALISNYKRAVEELVYNALDAGSTSVAVRINIEENSIQVIDNGTGIKKSDFPLLGQAYTTSKCVDLSSLKSAPDKYGFRGLSLASLIEVSEIVKITSRCADTEKTWLKVFTNGKQRTLSETTARPSKGTTVEVKGFLYNLKIRKNAIDSLSEINRIKTFLEQLSLVHSHVSLSLRNDSTNEIVFKIHKNRDTYQTLETLFGVDKKTVQEFKVEKNEYKVTAFIAKNTEETKQYHWIYLNGRIVRNSKFNKIVNENFSKCLKINKNTRNQKKKNFDEENVIAKNTIPTYFIFITCPNYDFDLSYTPNQKTLEFKNWDCVTKIIEKLVKFYTGDINLKSIKKNTFENRKSKTLDTRDQVKNIIQKILGSGPKKPAVSQMQKCVKGKLIKRKHIANKKQNKSKKLNISLSKVLPPRNPSVNSKEHIKLNEEIEENIECLNSNTVDLNKFPGCDSVLECGKESHTILGAAIPEIEELPQNIKHKSNEKERSERTRKNKDKIKPTKNLTKVNKTKHTNLQTYNKTRKHKLDPLAQKFETGLTESTKKLCDDLANKVDKLLKRLHKPRYEIFVNENVQYSNIISNNKNVSIRKKIDEIVIHNYAPISPESNVCSFDNRVWGKRTNIDGHDTAKSYDLLHTVLNTQLRPEEKCPDPSALLNTNGELPMPNEIYGPSYISSFSPNFAKTKQENFQSIRKLTYESHNYGKMTSINKTYKNVNNVCTPHKNHHFITKESRDNFLMPYDTFNFRKTRKHFILNNNIRFQNRNNYFNNIQHQYNLESSLTIEFSTSKSASKNENIEQYYNNTENSFRNDNNVTKIYSDENPLATYTINRDDENLYQPSNYRNTCSDFGNTYTVFSSLTSVRNKKQLSGAEKSEELKLDALLYKDHLDEMPERNVVFLSESQEKHDNNEIPQTFNQLEDCDAEIQIHEPNCNENKERQDASMTHEKFCLESLLCDKNIYTQQSRPIKVDQTVEEDISHHFEIYNTNNEKDLDDDFNSVRNTSKDLQTLPKAESEKFKFNFKNRLRFVPKGLSPIFENCRTKDVCDYTLEKDYFANAIYNNFAEEVQANVNIFESNMQNIKELHTKAIGKVNEKINKDHATLIFNGESIKNAMVLNQVDNKFIAVKMFSKADESKESTEHLILFDQHAVDERIRLEKCLGEYIIDNEWKSHTLDDAILLKLGREEIVYLHNYRDKFHQLGFMWCTSDNTITITSIPEAILGKHSRPVEVVIRAVKELILEQIHSMKTQNGCLTFYPKSLMDLIFSEACRYAIKFGDNLTKNECVELLNKLAECKTPFQCAHGRPVMAVLVDIKNQKHEYKVKFTGIQQLMKQKKNAKK